MLSCTGDLQIGQRQGDRRVKHARQTATWRHGNNNTDLGSSMHTQHSIMPEFGKSFELMEVSGDNSGCVPPTVSVTRLPPLTAALLLKELSRSTASLRRVRARSSFALRTNRSPMRCR